MTGRAKYFELLDFTKFAYPSVVGMDAAQTAYNLIERLGGGGFMSYGQIWPRMNVIVGGHATDHFVTTQFSAYNDDWKNVSIQEVVSLLSQHFAGRGTWYPFPMRPKKVLGFWFKPSIKGVWFVDGKPLSSRFAQGVQYGTTFSWKNDLDKVLKPITNEVTIFWLIPEEH